MMKRSFVTSDAQPRAARPAKSRSGIGWRWLRRVLSAPDSDGPLDHRPPDSDGPLDHRLALDAVLATRIAPILNLGWALLTSIGGSRTLATQQ
jgi:hypothetical protein